MGWRESLETLQKQFESQATRSRGLHHLMVEVADDERERMAGPEWFVREGKLGLAAVEAFQRAEPGSSSSGLACQGFTRATVKCGPTSHWTEFPKTGSYVTALEILAQSSSR